MDDEVTVISTYFVVGDCVYMEGVIRHHKLQTLHCFQSGFESFARLDKMTEGIVVLTTPGRETNFSISSILLCRIPFL
jgi:hypothetical protein